VQICEDLLRPALYRPEGLASLRYPLATHSNGTSPPSKINSIPASAMTELSLAKGARGLPRGRRTLWLRPPPQH
jgi:hypothetical protein